MSLETLAERPKPKPKPAEENQPSWRQELLESFDCVSELVQEGLLTPEEARAISGLEDRYRVRIPRYYASLMDRSPEGRSHCPIRRQALPAPGEVDPMLPDWARQWSLRVYGRPAPWINDAIGDVERLAAPRLTHRYENRAILHLSSLCALYCRFCFRKGHLNDASRALYSGELEPALEALSANPSIRELILTGGDPLSVSDGALDKLLGRLEKIAHLKSVRIHSRMPVTLPRRLTLELKSVLINRSYRVSLVSHFNHPRECTPLALSRLETLSGAGVALYNQSVLGRGINDDSQVLAELFQTLYESGVRPFYLHHPDWTPGTFHFRLPIARGRELVEALTGAVSGPAIPHYVLDLPGGHGKIPLMDSRLELLESRRDPRHGIAGNLYRVVRPAATRERAHAHSSQKPLEYAEFWREFPGS